MDLVSIIVPIYEVEAYLESCLHSIKNQTYSNIEVFCVNDGSKDQSRDIALRFTQEDSRFILLDKENGGLSDARNYALSYVKGKYIFFVDSDDSLEKNAIEIMMETATKYDADLIIGDYNQYWQTTNVKEKITSAHLENQMYTLKSNPELLSTIQNCAWNKLYRTSLFTEYSIEYPKGKRYEDLGTTYRILSEAKRIYFVHTPIYNYLIDRPGNITSAADHKLYDIFDMILINIDYFEKKQEYQLYYPYLRELAVNNIVECLRKLPKLQDKKFVNDFITHTFIFLKIHFKDYKKHTYQSIATKADHIYLSEFKLKVYCALKRRTYGKS